MARAWIQSFGPHTKCTEDKSQSPRNIIEFSSTEKFGCEDYLETSVINLLSYVVVVDFWFGEGGEIFGRSRAILDDPPPYVRSVVGT